MIPAGRDRTRGLVALALAMIAASGTVAAGGPLALQADVEADRVTTDGTAALDAIAYAVGVPYGHEAGMDSSWEFFAQSVRVETTARTFRVVPGVAAAEDGPPSHSNRTHPSPAAYTVGVGDRSFLLARAPADGNVFKISTEMPTASMTSSDRIDFRPHQNVLLYEGDDYGIHVRDASHLRASTAASARMSGDIVVQAYNVTFRLTDASGRTHEYYSGGTFDEGPGFGAPSTRYTETLITLHLEEASFVYRPDARGLETFLASGRADYDGSLALHNAVGDVRFAGHEVHVERQTVRVDAEGVDLSLAPAAGGRVAVTLDGEATAVRVDDEAITAGDGALLDADGWLRGAAWLLGGLIVVVAMAAAGTAWVLRRRRRDPDAALLEAERALLNGRFAAAARRARRVLKGDAASTDAALVQAIALMKMGRAEESVRRLGSFRAADREEAGLVELVTCLGLCHAGQDDEAAKRLEAALRKAPGLRDEIAGTDLFERFREHPRLRDLVDGAAGTGPEVAYG
jgi:hypothetical protein